MTLPQHVTFEVGGTIYLDQLTRPAAATVEVVTGSGAIIVAADTEATISSIDTVLAAAASRGATALNVSNTTGIANGSLLHLQDDPEAVLVASVGEGGAVTLRRPLLKDHASAGVVEGTRVSYALNATQAAQLWWDGHAKWTCDGVVDFTAVECTKFPLRRKATAQDLYDRLPKLYELLDPEVDIERLLNLGHDEVLERIGIAGRAKTFTGSSEFITATVLAAAMIHYQSQPTPEGKEMFERYREELVSKIEQLVAVVPRDANQSGTVEKSDMLSMRTVELRRA